MFSREVLSIFPFKNTLNKCMNKNTRWNPLWWLLHDFLIGIMTGNDSFRYCFGPEKLFSLNQQFIFHNGNDP